MAQTLVVLLALSMFWLPWLGTNPVSRFTAMLAANSRSEIVFSDTGLGQMTAIVDILDQQATYSFGSQLTVQATIRSTVSIREVRIFLQAEGEQTAIQGKVYLDQDGRYAYIQDLTQEPLRPFAKVIYWFGILLEDGEIVTSPVYSFYYEDNRYVWQTLELKPFRLHWYEGSLSFAQEIFNTAWDGWVRAKRIMPLSPPDEVEIYVYASAREVQSTLQLGGQTWVAGHADPDLGVIVVSLPPGPEQSLEMARQIPHELTHIMVYEKIGKGYHNLPVWFNEGLATMVELYPDPNYQLLLQNAYEQNNLIPLKSLCHAFPKDASGALLAYAEASSFMNYLYREYGSSNLEALMLRYAEGAGCEKGVQTVLKAELDQIDQDWRRDVFETKSPLNSFQGFMPWVVILILVMAAPLAAGVYGLYERS